MAFDYTPPTFTVESKHGNLTLRGLNVDDLGYLIQRHGELMNLVFEGDISVDGLLQKAPALCADMIACAAEDKAAADKAARLPLGLQLFVLTKVCELTFSEADMGNVLRLFVAAAKSASSPANLST